MPMESRKIAGSAIGTRASANEMHISADLEKIFFWGGRELQEPSYCVFKNNVTLWEVLSSLRLK